MALFQISEPDSPALERVVGIDLGTTHSLVAVLDKEGIPRTLADENGEVLLPSAVAIDESQQVYVGQAALSHPVAKAWTSFKRWIGRARLGTQDDAALKEHEGNLTVQTPSGLKNAIDFSAQVLYALRKRAELYFDDTVQGAVITVPAYFDEAQRQATKDAAEQAGLRVLRLLNEPTAAAIAYGLDEKLEGTYAVYDLGGGTFDLSILKLRAGIFEVISTAGNIALGGDDFDRVLAENLLPTPGSAGWDATVLRAMRQIKEGLTDRESLDVELTNDKGETQALSVKAADFQQWTQSLIDQTLHLVRRALKDAALKPEQIEGVVLVGGATRMPHVKASVERFFGRPALTNLDPDQVVALGAARQAVQLAQSNQDWLLLDVTPLSLGIETMGGLVEKIIPRNTTLPVSRAQEFTTFQDGQTAIKLHVLQGERESVKDCRSLAHFELKGIPPLPAGLARIKVTFQMDADGLLSVSAKELTEGKESTITVRPSEGLEGQTIEQQLQDAIAHASEDMQIRRRQEAQVEAQRLIYAVEQAVASDGHRLAQEERSTIATSMEQLRACLNDSAAEAAQITTLTKTLDEVSHTLATRRMDAAIAQRLEGQSINVLSS